jgi:hypothetical protein
VSRASILLSVALGLTALAAATCWLTRYDPATFKGAGPMKDNGYFAYYRYHAPIGEFPLAAAGTYSFKFSGLPNERMGLQLYVPGRTTSNRSELENLSTELTAVIADASGKTICSVKGTPAGHSEADKWTLMSSFMEAGYWHRGCLERPFSRRTNYTLRVTVANVDPKTPHVSLRAWLEGGGSELP